MMIDCVNIGQTNRASDYLYMHMQTVSLAALAGQVLPDNIGNGKNWMTIDCDNIGQTDRASDYLYMHIQTTLLAALDSPVQA
jgi:hypothetical protein